LSCTEKGKYDPNWSVMFRRDSMLWRTVCRRSCGSSRVARSRACQNFCRQMRGEIVLSCCRPALCGNTPHFPCVETSCKDNLGQNCKKGEGIRPSKIARFFHFLTEISLERYARLQKVKSLVDMADLESL